MKNNIEQLPVSIFEWSMQSSFNELNKGQQDEVLLYMSKSEYDELHFTTIDTIKAVANDDTNKNRIKSTLLSQYDLTYPNNTMVVHSNQNLFWKVAATLLLLGTIGLTYMVMRKTEQLQRNNFITSTDTVFMQASAPTYRIVDTVYLEVEKPRNKRQQKSMEINYSSATQLDLGQTSDMHIGGIKDINDDANKIKQHSIKDDSLINAFQFVTL